MHKDTTFFLIPTNKKGNKTENEDFLVLIACIRALKCSIRGGEVSSAGIEWE